MDSESKVHITPRRADVDLDKVKQLHSITHNEKIQLIRVSGRQLAYLSRLISDTDVTRYSKIKAGLGLAGISALDLSRADCQRLIAELQRLRSRRR